MPAPETVSVHFCTGRVRSSWLRHGKGPSLFNVLLGDGPRQVQSCRITFRSELLTFHLAVRDQVLYPALLVELL
jgi:hypothetical protein